MKYLQETLTTEFGKRFIDNTELPEYFGTSLNPAKTLRPYQELCFKYFVNYWENDFEGKDRKPHLLFHMATGSGKTLIMAGLILYLYNQGYRNFLFFVNSNNIIEKTRENFFDIASNKYLFAPTITIGNKQVEIRQVDNFQDSDPDSINFCLTTIQGLHDSLNNPQENSLTYEDFAEHRIALISDEAHHINASTKKGKKAAGPTLPGPDIESNDWESTVAQIFNSNDDNVLLEFTATEDFQDPNIAEKYDNKVIFNYELKQFRKDRYSKDVETVESELPIIDRAIQAVILSQYKRKLFESLKHNIKPVIMFKSKQISDNKLFFDQFITTIESLTVSDIERIRDHAKGYVLDLFTYLDEKGIDLQNFLLELKEDFRQDKLLLVDGKNITPEKQRYLNSLEDSNNEYRAVFAVDMLNEGWDVLNLFDIVRLYDTRDGKAGKVGPTTMAEAQLIGRGARYMPFTVPGSDLPSDMRKFDEDAGSRYRVLEILHYHSANNPKYIAELHKALVESGIVEDNSRVITLRFKESFKKSRLYTNGYVFANELVKFYIHAGETSFSDEILSKEFKVRLNSRETASRNVFTTSGVPTSGNNTIGKLLKLGEFGSHIIRAALNRFDTYKFANLHEIYPELTSVKDFIESQSFLSGLNVQIFSTQERLNSLSQKDRLYCCMEVLRQLEPMLAKGGIGQRGSELFTPRQVRDVFKEKTIRITPGSEDKEFGRSMKESLNPDLRLDLSVIDWHAYEDCYGTSEEKYLIRYIQSIYDKLAEKYKGIYLLRNERDLKLFSFEDGRAYEPDYVLFLSKDNADEKADYIQIFIEPKGNHLLVTDKLKEEQLKLIHEKADIRFSTQNSDFIIWGMPFFNEDNRKQEFNSAMKQTLNF